MTVSSWIAVTCVAFLAAVLLESAAMYRWSSGWQIRGIEATFTKRATSLRLVTPTVLGAAAGFWWSSVAAAFAFSAVVWLALLAADTDLRSRKIPLEACWGVFWLGTAAGASYAVWIEQVFPFMAALTAFLLIGFITLGAALATRGGLGSGDVRMLLAFTVMAWWTGVIPLLIGVVIAGLVQAVARLVLLGQGRRSERLPFGPALIVGTAVSVAVMTVMGWPSLTNSCIEWLACPAA